MTTRNIIVLTEIAIAIETFELTGIGAQLWQSPNPALKLLGIVLGTTFGWWDILAYVVGTIAISLFDRWLIAKQCYSTRQFRSAGIPAGTSRR